MLVIRDGAVITGDGTTILNPATVYVEGDRILEVRSGRVPLVSEGDTVLDAHDHVVFPGLINIHTHGCTTGPFLPTAAAPLSREQALKNLDKHLSFGTTTIVNADGFVLPEEAAEMDSIHPINVFTGTTHTPSNFQAASSIDGEGLTQRHCEATAEDMIDAGAVLLGEVGGGVTLGGGGMDYRYIPMAIKKLTGIDPEVRHCRDLKWAALGRHIDKDDCDLERVQRVLEDTGLAEVLSAEEARDLIFATVLPPFDLSLQGFKEATEVGSKCGVPVLVHNSAPSDEATREAARRIGSLLIAAHTNHSTFTVEESLANARDLRRLGAVIEVCTLDLFGAKQMESGTDYIYALLQEGLVDTWATDYAAGFWDCQLIGIEATVQDGQSSLPALIAMASANVARVVPGVGDRGMIAPQKVADIVVAPSAQLSKVREVIVGGKVVFRNGTVLRNPES